MTTNTHTATYATVLSILEPHISKPRTSDLTLTILQNVCNHFLRLEGKRPSVLSQEDRCTHKASFQAELPNGGDFLLSELKGKVVLVVNVASQWYAFRLRS